jgi:hypothetical protein
MAQHFGYEKVAKLQYTSTTQVTLLSGSNLRIGGQGYPLTSNIVCTTSTSGFGGIDTGSVAASTFYYVYAVVSSGVVGLVASTSATAPTGFSGYRKVGAFYTNGSSQVFKAYWFGEVNNLIYTASGTAGATDWSMSPANWIASQTALGTGRTEHTPTTGIFSVNPNAVASPTQASIGQHFYMESVLTNSIIVRGSNATPALANEAGMITVTKNDIDATQPDWSL